MKTVDTIIVGAGFSGLAAATKLARSGHSVALLEARDRVGGRCCPVQIAGVTMDIGGMWLGPTQTRLSELAAAYAVSTYPTILNGHAKVGFGAGSPAILVPEEALEQSLPPEAWPDLEKLFTALEETQADLNPESPWTHPNAEKLDAQTLSSWIDETIEHRDVKTMMSLFCYSLVCAEPAQVSALFFMFYLKSGGGLELMVSGGDGGAQNFAFEGGVFQIAENMAKSLGGSIHLSCPVHKICQSDEGVQAWANNECFDAKTLIVATPPNLTSMIDFEPSLPARKRGLLARQPMGSCIKWLIAYETPFWRESGLNGFTVNADCPFTPLFDVSPPKAGIGVIAGFFDGSAAVEFSDAPFETRKQIVLEELESAFGPRAAHPVDYAEKNWPQEKWTGGCYGNYMAPGTLTSFGQSIREPHGRVYWAGTETSAIWSGYFEGAIRAGERSASDVIDFLKP